MVMWKKPDESLIGQCDHNITQGFLLLSLLWYQKIIFAKFSIIKFAFSVFLYQNSSSLDVALNRYWAPTLISYSEKQIGAWNRSCLWPFVGHQEKVTNLESRERSLYSFKTVHNYFWNSLRQTSKSTWKEADIWCNFTDSSSNR